MDRGTEWEALAIAPPRTDFRGFSSIVDGLGVTWPVIQSTSRLCWNSQFIPKITSQEGSRSVITNITLVGSMAESRMESWTASVTQTEVVIYENDFSGGHRSFQKMEVQSKLGIDEAKFSARVQ